MVDFENLKHAPYSPSRLETAFCPFDFYNKYVDPEGKKKPKVENLPQARGSAVHEIFENITKRFCLNQACTFKEEEVMDWVREAVVRHPAAQPEMNDIFKMARLYIVRPPKLITSDSETELKLAVKWDKVKQDFIECSYDDPKAFARGRADIMVISDDTTSAIIYDHKTQPNIEEADTFQLGFYAWVISKIYPFLDTISTVLHFAQYGAYSEPYTWTREQLKEVEQEIITRISVVESFVDWPAIVHNNTRCMYCNNNANCPLFLEFAEILPDGTVRTKLNNFEIMDTMKAVQAASLITMMEECAKKLKKNLKDYCKNTGPIALTGKVYAFSSEESINWDKTNKNLRNDIYELFDLYAIDVRKYMSFNQSHTPAIWTLETDQEFLRKLSLLFPRKIAVEFGGTKI